MVSFHSLTVELGHARKRVVVMIHGSVNIKCKHIRCKQVVFVITMFYLSSFLLRKFKKFLNYAFYSDYFLFWTLFTLCIGFGILAYGAVMVIETNNNSNEISK